MINNSVYRDSLERIIPYVLAEEKKFLVTGASGLIGSSIIDLLMLCNRQNKKNHVYALGRSKEKLENRFSSFVSDDYFHVIEQDICQEINDDNNYDFIIHGASNADPVTYAQHPVGTMKTTLVGALNILEYGRKHKNCKIVMLSTFEVYGKSDHDIYSEHDAGVIDFNLLRACYPEAKRSMEILSKCFVDEYGVQVSIVRLGSIYGPTMLTTDSKAHAQFIRKALNQEDIILKSKGDQRRTYCYVVDAISGILTVLFSGKTGESYNVSNDDATVTIADVAHALAKIASVDVVFDNPSLLEAKGFSKPQDVVLDCSKLRSLGWRPIYGLQEGLRDTLNILKR